MYVKERYFNKFRKINLGLILNKMKRILSVTIWALFGYLIIYLKKKQQQMCEDACDAITTFIEGCFSMGVSGFEAALASQNSVD